MATKKKKNKGENKKLIVAVIFVIAFIIVVITMQQGKTGFAPVPTQTQQSGNTSQVVERTATIHLEQQGNNTINVVVDAGNHPISGVQLQLAYDPRILSNVTIQKGNFFSQAIELQNKVDDSKGIINYAIGILPTGKPQAGKQVLATISYTPNLGLTSSTQITFLPGTKVTAEGIDQSVLQLPDPFTLTFSK